MGSVFAPASGAQKRPRIKEIHGAIKKHAPPRKRICLGGGRVSGRSGENLITCIISRANLVQQQTVEVSPFAKDYGRATQRHLPPSFRRPTMRGPATLQERLYSPIHAETEARATQLRATLAAAGASGAQPAATQEVNVTSLLPRVQEHPVELASEGVATRERHLPASFFSSILGPTVSIGIPSWQVRLHADMELRRYSEIHAETEAALPNYARLRRYQETQDRSWRRTQVSSKGRECYATHLLW